MKKLTLLENSTLKNYNLEDGIIINLDNKLGIELHPDNSQLKFNIYYKGQKEEIKVEVNELIKLLKTKKIKVSV